MVLNKDICRRCISEHYPNTPFNLVFDYKERKVTESELFDLGYVCCCCCVVENEEVECLVADDGTNLDEYSVSSTEKIPDKCLYYLEHVVSEGM